MKSAFTKFLIVTLSILLVLTIAGPYVVLAIARQPIPESNYEYSDSFLTTYGEVRDNVLHRIDTLRNEGYTVLHESYAIEIGRAHV